MQAAERGCSQLDYQLCPHCDYAVGRDFLRCPNCVRKLGPLRACRNRSTRSGGSARTARPRSRARRAAAPPPASPKPPPPEPAARRRAVRSSPATLTPPNPKETSVDRTLILVKPDAFARGLTGEIIARFERKGLKLVALQADARVDERARQAALRRARRQPFFGELVEFITCGSARRDGARGRAGRHRRAPGDRRHQPARGRARLDPRRLRASRSARTWSTAPTRPSPARARPRCSSPSCEGRRDATPGWCSPRFAAAPRDPGAARDRVRGPARPRRRGAPGRAASRSRSRTRWQGARRAAARPGEIVLGVDTIVAFDGRALGRPRRRRRARERCARLAGRAHQVVSGIALVARTARSARGDE